jgi:hypothetical protein
MLGGVGAAVSNGAATRFRQSWLWYSKVTANLANQKIVDFSVTWNRTCLIVGGI